MTLRGLGLIPDAPDERDYGLCAMALGDAPETASLVEHVCSVADQGWTSSCVGFATAQAVYVAQGVAGVSPRMLPHPLAIYHDARRLAHGRDCVLDDAVDRGCSPRLAWQSLRDGVVSVADYPVDLARVDAEVPWGARRLAADRTWLTYFRVEESGDERCTAIRRAIAAGHPVCVGLTVDQEFLDWAGPWPWQRQSAAVGRHMVCAVGYALEYLVVANSWGSPWGMGGIGLVGWPEVAGPGTSDCIVPVLDVGRMP